MTKLPALTSPALTSTQGIFAQKRKGKSYTAQTQAEDFLEEKRQIAVIDPTGAWWGLRSSADGKRHGYPITIFGGDHADAPLELKSGRIIAEALVDQRFSAVLDLTLFDPDDWAQLVGDFLDRLYTLNKNYAMHVFIDEVDQFAPQNTESKAQQQCRRIVNRLIRLGGIKGIGCTVITQRTAVLDKSILSQCETIIALQMNGARDLDAIRKELANHTSRDQVDEVIGSLGSLPRGQAWQLSPATKTFQRVSVRTKRTFDSGRTPDAGEVVTAPKSLAPVDIKRLGAAIAATVEKAKANDPVALKAKVAELEKLLAAKSTAKVETKTVEKAVVKAEQLNRIEKLIANGEKLITRWDDVSANAYESLLQVEHKTKEGYIALQHELAQLRTALSPTRQPQQFAPNRAQTSASRAPVAARQRDSATAGGSGRRVTGVTAGETAPSDGKLPPAQQRILDTLATLDKIGIESSRSVLAAWLGTHPNSKGYVNNIGALRSAGLLQEFQLTDEGRWRARPLDMPTDDHIREALLDPLKPAQRRIVEIVLAHGSIGREDLAAELNCHPNTKGLVNNIGALRGRSLLTDSWPITTSRAFEGRAR